MGLKIITTKTEMMHRAEASKDCSGIYLSGNRLPETPNFVYPGRYISKTCSNDKKLSNRINKASASFCGLKERVYINK